VDVRRRGGVVALAVVLLGACTPHPVGPARTADAYEGKATTTIDGALSSVQTVRLVIGADDDDHATSTYTAMVVSEQEDTLAGLSGTFGSVQPPDSASDALRDDVDELLTTALGHVADARIAARRGGGDELWRLAGPLADDAQALREFLEDHP
jgi:hypothetical protein